MPDSLYNEVAGNAWDRCFPVNFAKFLRTLFYRTPLVATSAYLQNYVLLSDEKSISNLFEANGIVILLMIASYINDFI